jgi:hypothetical protein
LKPDVHCLLCAPWSRMCSQPQCWCDVHQLHITWTLCPTWRVWLPWPPYSDCSLCFTSLSSMALALSSQVKSCLLDLFPS